MTVCFAAGEAFAQTATEAVALDEITVEATEGDDKHAGAADRANAITVGREQVEASALGDLKDLFAGEAAITVGGGISIAQKIFVNGVDMLNLAVSLDGALQNNRSFHHVAANAIDPGLLKVARVDPTVAPADAGPNALGGAIVFETVDAADLLEEGKNFGGYGQLGFDSNGETLSEALSLYGRAKGFEVLGYIRNAKGEDYETGRGTEIEGTASDLQSYVLKGAYEKDGHRVEVSGQALIDDALRPYRANFGGVIGGRPTPATRVYDTDRRNYTIRYERTEPVGLWDPVVVLGFSENKINVPEPYDSRGTASTLSGKIENTFALMEGHALTAGVDFYDRTGLYEGPGERYEESAQNVGVYLQHRADLTEAWTVSVGGRADIQQFDGIGGFSNTVSGVSGNASVRYEVVDDLFLKAGVSSVFGGISIEDNYVFLPSWTYDDLDASRGNNVVVGFEYRPDRWFVEGSVFRTDVTDARNGIKNADFVTEGFNVGAGYSWTGGFIKATYSNTEIEVNDGATGSYEALDFGAPVGQVIAVTAQHTFEAYDLTLGARLDMALDYDGPIGAADATKGLEGYEVVSLFAEYEPRQFKGLKVRLEANNIFDEAYADRATYGGEYDSVVQLEEPGRSFFVTVKQTF